MWCVCLKASECISLYFSTVRVCVCVHVGVLGGLMGSVGAQVLREQLSLIIQTRLIIKAAQISPWFHLNCRQAAPLRQAVVTLGRLCLSLYHYRACCTPLCSAPYPVLNPITASWPRASLIHISIHCNSRNERWTCYFYLHRCGMFCFVSLRRRNLQSDAVGFRLKTYHISLKITINNCGNQLLISCRTFCHFPWFHIVNWITPHLFGQTKQAHVYVTVPRIFVLFL